MVPFRHWRVWFWVSMAVVGMLETTAIRNGQWRVGGLT